MSARFVTDLRHNFDIDVITVYRLNRKGQRRVDCVAWVDCECPANVSLERPHVTSP